MVVLAEAFGSDVAQLLFAGAGLLRVEQAGRVLRGQSDGHSGGAAGHRR
jgi:hypothetical protein